MNENSSTDSYQDAQERMRKPTNAAETQGAIQRSDERLSFVLQAAGLGYWDWDFTCNELSWSEHASSLLGLTADTRTSYESFLGALHPEDRDRTDRAVREAIQSGGTYDTEYRTMRPDGGIRWICSRGRVYYDVGGQPTRMSGVAWDITDRKATEEALLKSERDARERAAELDAILDTIPAAVFIAHDQECRYMTSSRVAYDLLQLPFGVNASATAPTEVRPEYAIFSGGVRLSPQELPMQRAAATGKELRDVELEFRFSGGDSCNVYGHAVPLFDTDGNVRGSVGAFVDITPKKQIEQELRKSEQELRTLNHALQKSESEARAIAAELSTILEVAPAITFIARDTKCEDVVSSRFAREYLQVPDGISTSMTAPPEVRPPFKSFQNGRELSLDELPLQIAAATGREMRDFELTIAFPDGTSKDMAGNAAPLFDGNGKPRGAVAVCIDVTSRKKAEDALRKAEKLAVAGRLAASIAHEINNPLEAVTNLVYLLKGASSLDQVREFAQLAEDELARVSTIVTQTLRFYRQSSRATPATIQSIVDPLLALYRKRYPFSSVEVIRNTEDLPIIAYHSELRQAFSNLIGNAFEATRDGGRILVREHRATDYRSGRSGVRVTIADTGSGMNPETLKHLFEPFFTTKGETGTGLGLWITKGIIDKHGGSIRVRTSQAPHSGTVFSVFLPAEMINDASLEDQVQVKTA